MKHISSSDPRYGEHYIMYIIIDVHHQCTLLSKKSENYSRESSQLEIAHIIPGVPLNGNLGGATDEIQSILHQFLTEEMFSAEYNISTIHHHLIQKIHHCIHFH